MVIKAFTVIATMPAEEQPLSSWVAMGVGGLLLLLIIFLQCRILIRLKRLEQINADRHTDDAPNLSGDRQSDSKQLTHFDQFLEEEPSRKLLSKSEQAEAFRKWRTDRGLNWSK